MPWIETLTDVKDLRRCIRDLVAISTLPAIWKDYDPYQIADGVAAALRSMLDLELVHISMRKGFDDPPIEITHTSNPQNYSALAEIRAALSSGNAAEQIKNCGLGDGQANHGQLRIASIPISLGGDAIIIAASRQPDFPTELQRLLIGVGANEAAIALQRWRAETSHRRFSLLLRPLREPRRPPAIPQSCGMRTRWSFRARGSMQVPYLRLPHAQRKGACTR